jgi:methionine-rich copper-binding protein CopC
MSVISSTRARVLATAALLVGAAALGGASRAAYHATLKKSWPAAHDTLAAAPDSLKLWFSEKVEIPLTKIALVSAGNAKALSAPAFLGEAADAPIVLAVKDKLAPGSYTVNWTVAGKDGHPSKGTYDFVVKAGK